MEYEGQFVSNKDGEDLERQYAKVMFLDIFAMRISLLFTAQNEPVVDGVQHSYLYFIEKTWFEYDELLLHWKPKH